jgi:hypothetical protein
MKARKKAPQVAITEDDAKLVAEKVQYRGEEDVYVMESEK